MVYQILIVLDQITPKIWRRVFVHEDTLLFDFHIIIQIAMGWENCHLHQFIKEGKYYSERMDNDNFWDDALNVEYTGMTIGDLLKNKGDQVIYEYDFGDSWIHTLTLEAIHNSANTSTQVPSCIAGERPCPAEDSGGPFLYKPPGGKGKTTIDLDAINSLLSEYDSGFEGIFEDGFEDGFEDASEEEEVDVVNSEETYKDILYHTKTKEQIIFAARSFGLKIKTSANKETCAAFIEQALQQDPSLLRKALSYNELKTLYIFFKDSGSDSGSDSDSGPGSNSANPRLPEQDESAGFSIEDLEGLLLTGLVGISFDDKAGVPKFYLPNNMKETLFPELQRCIQDQTIKKAYHIENLFLGMLTLYGALPLKKLEELFNRYLPETLSLPSLLTYLKSNRLCRKYNATYSSKHIMFFYHSSIPDVKTLIAEIEQRKDLEYASFTEPELLQASNYVYYYKNSFSQRLLKQLYKFDIPDTDIFMHEIWVKTQIETSAHSMLEFISEQLVFDDFRDLQDTLKVLIDYQNSIPQWTLKGNVPGAFGGSNASGRHHAEAFGGFGGAEASGGSGASGGAGGADTFVGHHAEASGGFGGAEASDGFGGSHGSGGSGSSGGSGASGRPAPSDYPVFAHQPGRNDPCPCGSGKKFKHCCGNN